MGILGRIDRVIRGSLNDILDKMSDPAKEVDLLIFEMERGLKDAKQEVITAVADGKQSDRRVEALKQDVARWQGRAEQAVGLNDDELARKALGQKMAVQRDGEQALQTQAKQWAYVDELKQALKALEQRLDDAKLRKETLKQRARASKADGPLAGGKAFSEFDRLEARIEGAEEAQALARPAELRDAELNAKLRRLEGGDPVIDDELEALKRKLDEER